ncbi:MAG: hypothetical protein HRU38_23060 [Saccharospirillaceae bacterium]|nr:DUF6174 domain-containing protein [Pseudomonadales bacterium]NRB81504.1 hypothetical protein [Saccharospirillaceae bacterium]
MKGYLKVLLLSSIFISVTSCSYIKSFKLQAQTSKYNEAKQLWDSKNTTGSYQFTINRFCQICVEGDVEVFVSDDKITQIIQVETGNMIGIGSFSTIDEQFEWIEGKLNTQPYPAELEVEYDVLIGYPTSIVYDASKAGADDEYSEEVTAFKF